MEISSLFLGLCNVLKDIAQHWKGFQRKFLLGFSSFLLHFHYFGHKLLVLFLALFKEREGGIGLILCAICWCAFLFLHLLLVLAYFGAAFFLLTPLDDLDWKNNDLEKAISSSSESKFGDCDLGMLLVPADDASDRTFFEASNISLSKAIFFMSSWFKATSLLSRTCCESTDSLPQALHPYHESFAE